jgi:hypothetical protein
VSHVALDNESDSAPVGIRMNGARVACHGDAHDQIGHAAG